MDEDATDAAWAEQEQQERHAREQASLRSARIAQAELKALKREFDDLNLNQIGA